MMYKVVSVNSLGEPVSDIALFQKLGDAVLYTKIHKFEYSATDESLRIDEVKVATDINIPPFHEIVVQTFATQWDDSAYTMQGRLWNLDEVRGYSPVNTHKEGEAVVFADDAEVKTSFTIIFPVSTVSLIDDRYTTEDLITVAKNLFIEKTKHGKAVENYKVESFDITKYLK